MIKKWCCFWSCWLFPMGESLQRVKIPSSRLAVSVLGGYPSPYLGKWLQCVWKVHRLISWLFPASYLSRSFSRLCSWSNLQNVVITKDRNLYSLQFNVHVKHWTANVLKTTTKTIWNKILDFYQKNCKTGLFQHNNVTTM